MKQISGAVLLAAAIALSACNSIDPTMGMRQAAPSPNATAGAQMQANAQGSTAAQSPAASSSTAGPPAQLVAVNRAVRLNIAPIVGAPVADVAPLSHRLQEDARARGMVINGEGDPTTTHILKGYFSTLSEGSQTTVIYVWDVLDPSGNRLHRIEGQQKVAGSADDPWAIVTPQAMEAIADETVQTLVQWINSSPS